MRSPSIHLVAFGLGLAACGEPGGPSPGNVGTLVVSTSTGGNAPDEGGYLLTVDDADSLVLPPTGHTELAVPAGRHTLRLLDVPTHCSVTPAAALDVDVGARDTTSVALEFSCVLTGVRITLETTGLDIDPDGYSILVDGADQGAISADAKVRQILLDPGDHAISLTGLAPNCAIDGPGSSTVAVADGQLAAITFAVVCTATSGVLALLVDVIGDDGGYRFFASLDGASSVSVTPGRRAYLTDVAPGEHVVALFPPVNCSPVPARPVTVTASGLTRDTVVVDFAVECVSRTSGIVRITAPTRGTVPAQSFTVEICVVTYDCIFYGTWRPVGQLAPNDTLVLTLRSGRYQLWLRDVPSGCRAASILSPEFTVSFSSPVKIEFRVSCSS